MRMLRIESTDPNVPDRNSGCLVMVSPLSNTNVTITSDCSNSASSEPNRHITERDMGTSPGPCSGGIIQLETMTFANVKLAVFQRHRTGREDRFHGDEVVPGQRTQVFQKDLKHL
jgi:hypothetical protein